MALYIATLSIMVQLQLQLHIIIFVVVLPRIQSLTLNSDNVTIDLEVIQNAGLSLTLFQGGQQKTEKLTGRLAPNLNMRQVATCNGNSTCYKAGSQDEITLSVSPVSNGFGFRWEGPSNVTYQDCFQLYPKTLTWFSGQLGRTSEWPTQNLQIKNEAHVVTTSAPVSEPYWLNSLGVVIFVNESTPLFVDQNNLMADNLCLIAKSAAPYINRHTVSLNYTIVARDDARQAHLDAVVNYLGRPAGQPDKNMLEKPIWSTSIKYGNDINKELLVDLAQMIKSYGFTGQLIVEDGWEECYGSLEFSRAKFPGIQRTAMDLKSMAFKIILGIHPFVNDDCQKFTKIGQQNDYFVKSTNGSDLTSWWNGNKSHLIDFTNSKAEEWYSDRVQAISQKYNFDGFKLVAGETSWMPANANQDDPDQFTTNYNNMSSFTTFGAASSGYRTQSVPVFIRMPEKEPNWSRENGLRSVIINLLQLNLAGYTLVLPGLIGGHGERPSPELFIRWTQAVTLMPALQFGYLPWEVTSYQYDVFAIVKKFMELHAWYSDKIRNVMIKSRTMGLPVNSPVWWIDPTNAAAFKIDDQFLLGEDFLVAPVLTQGAVSRDIYLPPGTWRDGNNQSTYAGGQTLKNYAAPLDILPYFVKQN